MPRDRANIDNALSVVRDGWKEGVGVVELFHVHVTRINVNDVFTDDG